MPTIVLLSACALPVQQSLNTQVEYLHHDVIAQIKTGMNAQQIMDMLQHAPQHIHHHADGETWVWIEEYPPYINSLAVSFVAGKAISQSFFRE